MENSALIQYIRDPPTNLLEVFFVPTDTTNFEVLTPQHSRLCQEYYIIFLGKFLVNFVFNMIIAYGLPDIENWCAGESGGFLRGACGKIFMRWYQDSTPIYLGFNFWYSCGG